MAADLRGRLAKFSDTGNKRVTDRSVNLALFCVLDFSRQKRPNYDTILIHDQPRMDTNSGNSCLLVSIRACSHKLGHYRRTTARLTKLPG